MLESAVRSLQTVTDQMPMIEVLQGLFPNADLLEDCVIKIYTELIDLCYDCISLFCRKWYSESSLATRR